MSITTHHKTEKKEPLTGAQYRSIMTILGLLVLDIVLLGHYIYRFLGVANIYTSGTGEMNDPTQLITEYGLQAHLHSMGGEAFVLLAAFGILVLAFVTGRARDIRWQLGWGAALTVAVIGTIAFSHGALWTAFPLVVGLVLGVSGRKISENGKGLPIKDWLITADGKHNDWIVRYSLVVVGAVIIALEVLKINLLA